MTACQGCGHSPDAHRARTSVEASLGQAPCRPGHTKFPCSCLRYKPTQRVLSTRRVSPTCSVCLPVTATRPIVAPRASDTALIRVPSVPGSPQLTAGAEQLARILAEYSTPEAVLLEWESWARSYVRGLIEASVS